MIVRIAAFSSKDSLDHCESTVPTLRFSRALEQAPLSLTLHSPIDGPVSDASTAVTPKTEIEVLKIELEMLRKENASLRKRWLGYPFKMRWKNYERNKLKKRRLSRRTGRGPEQLSAQEKGDQRRQRESFGLEKGN
jgi:hypothetical protein